MFWFGVSWMRSGGSISIGSSGFVGSASCASKVAAKARPNGNAIRRIIEKNHLMELAQTEAQMRARETARSLDSTAMAFDDRPETAAVAQRATGGAPVARRPRRPGRLKTGGPPPPFRLGGLFPQ